MNKVQFVHIPFTQNLIHALLKKGSDNALYIFPTKAGKRAAIREFQNHWNFQNIQFLTMEELKELLIESNEPILKEEKRSLAFYASLTAADKQFFKINNYFQAIEPALHFFELWEEFNEELLDDINHNRLKNGNADMLSWQQDVYDKLKDIKENYREFIQRHGFSDNIFLSNIHHFKFNHFSSFQSIHFINQFYYTALERKIIHNFAENGVTTVLYYQLPPGFVDPDTLAIKPFTIRDLGRGRTEQINIIECKNEFTMLCGLLEQVHEQKVHSVVNFSPSRTPYSRFLSPQYFNLGTSKSLIDTSIFQFLQTLHNLLKDILYEPSRRLLLVPIQSMLDAILNPHFSAYLIEDETEPHQFVVDYLYDLIGQEYKFIDIEGTFFHARQRKDAVIHLQHVLKFIHSFLNINSIGSFVDKIDVKEGIRVDAVLTEQEKKATNLREIFYRVLADFARLEQIGLIENWHTLFTHTSLSTRTQTPAGLLRLFLDYLKSRSIQYSMIPADSPRVDFIDLQDTRNIYYKNVAIMNVIEKEIPHSRQTPFLFTERQRQLLGLKTYEDIKLREKYYFMRLVQTSPYVSLLTQKNIEQNIELSSFVEEIRLYFSKNKINMSRISEKNYAVFYKALLHSKTDYHISEAGPNTSEFYTIPLQLERDFPQNCITLSYYSLVYLFGNAFTYYLKKVIRMEEKSKNVSTDYSPLLIGNIVHDCLNHIWKDMLDQYQIGAVEIDFTQIPDDLLDKALNRILRADRFYYASPHNHAQIYFQEILVPRIKAGLVQFFHYLNRIGLSNTPLEILPEKEDMMMRDEHITYIKSENKNFSIDISGRADLRIESADKSHFYIFDYKTGGYNKEQLILYELYYYLIRQTARQEDISSYFYQVLNAEGKELREFNRRKSKKEIIGEFDQKVQDQVNEFWKNGFALPEKKYMLDDMGEISRKDLYLTKYLPLKRKNSTIFMH